jgi:hypothetical protein
MSFNVMLKAVKDTLSGDWGVAAEVLDLTISAASDGVFNDVPLVGTGLKVLQVKDKFQEHKFRRNCQALLLDCEQVDNEAKRNTLDRLSANPEQFDDFVDTLMLIACESSKPFKAGVVGRLLAKMLQGQLAYETYDELVHIVHAAPIPALKALKAFGDSKQGNIGQVHRDHSAHEPLLLSLGVASRFGNALRTSGYGDQLYKFGLC